MELDLSKYLEAFATEVRERLQQMEQALLEMERAPGTVSPELLNEMFRAAHTVKGAAAAMEFTDIATLAHRLESCFDMLRSGKASVTTEVVDAMLAAVDALGKMVGSCVEGQATEVDADSACSLLESAMSGQDAASSPAQTATTTTVERMTTAQPERIESIRVKVDQLDALVDLVGELVTVRSRLLDVAERYELEDLSDGLDQLTQITNDLRSQALRLRMVPVARVFDRFPRAVRDLAKELNKEVEFTVSGREIELDRTILDQLHDPLLHLLRNALDHGLEPPEERTRLGKPAKGRLSLSARREREHVVIEVTDDGRGMDVELLKAKAIQRGMITAEEAVMLSEAQALMLVCEPGFSTAEQVTTVSGRGVGMDVVKTAVESVGGSMDISSRPGEGTTFALHLPITLAIIRVLLIRLGTEVYGIPLSNVLEAVSGDDVTIRTIGSREVTTIRDMVLPVLHTQMVLEVPDAPTNGENGWVLVVEGGRQRMGMLVDGLIGQQEVVIKPLTSLVRRIRGFAGATILGDGRVVLVLDPVNLLG